MGPGKRSWKVQGVGWKLSSRQGWEQEPLDGAPGVLAGASGAFYIQGRGWPLSRRRHWGPIRKKAGVMKEESREHPQGGQDGGCSGRRTIWAHGRHQPGPQQQGRLGLWPRLLFPILGRTSVAPDFQKIVHQLSHLANYCLRQNWLFLSLMVSMSWFFSVFQT